MYFFLHFDLCRERERNKKRKKKIVKVLSFKTYKSRDLLACFLSQPPPPWRKQGEEKNLRVWDWELGIRKWIAFWSKIDRTIFSLALSLSLFLFLLRFEPGLDGAQFAEPPFCLSSAWHLNMFDLNHIFSWNSCWIKFTPFCHQWNWNQVQDHWRRTF